MIKVKRNLLIVVAAILFAVCGITIFGITNNTPTAYAQAATDTARYKLDVKSIGTDGIYLYGTYRDAVETASDGAVFNFSPTTLSVVLLGKSKLGRYTYTRFVKNVELSGPVTFSETASKKNTGGGKKTVTYSLPTLTEGYYTLTMKTGADYSGVVGDQVSTVTYHFYYDKTAPTISGASTSPTGRFVNSAFTVTASDSLSGVSQMYMMSPTASTYTAVGTSKTVSAGSTNGLYKFYATDNGGTSSSTYYVYYDSTLPTVTMKSASGTTLSGSYVNQAFYCTASDTGSGVSYMQYKTPSSSTWVTYNSGTTIPTTAASGTYQFRAVDKANNVSAVTSVYFDSTKPTGVLYADDRAVSNGSTVTASHIKFMATDNQSGLKNIYVKTPSSSSYSAYVNGSQYAVSGKYMFYCVDYANNTSVTYTINLDNEPPTILCEQTEFYFETAYDFTIKARDEFSSVKLFYKTPLMSEYAAASGSSYSVTTKDSDGKYYFYAEDALGNRSETKWVELKVAAPEATVERDGDTNYYRVIWDGSSTGRLNDTPYTKGDWITTEGEYTFVITNSSNRSATYHFTIAHSFVPNYTVPQTCTEQGYTVYKCLTCDSTYNADFVEADGHSYSEELIVETCEEGAHYLYTCTVCGHQYKSEYITAGGHKHDKTVINPTCTERGYTIYKCTVCGYTFRDDYTDMLGHNYKTTVLEPTCLKGGYTTYECKRCGDEYISDYKMPTGHSYEESVVAPTCTERGYNLHECVNCGDSYKTDETLALGHSYTETTVEVTCTQNGCIKHTCTKCGYVYETNIIEALGHKYVSEVTMPATCTDDGNRHYICSRCGEQYDTAITAFGHTYEITDIESNGGVTIRTYTCSICGHSYTQNLGDQYEEVSNYVEFLFRQYSPYMYWVFLATAGVWSIAMGIAIIIAHKNDDKQKAKKMLVNYVIGIVVIFAILVACPYLVRGIASLIAG